MSNSHQFFASLTCPTSVTWSKDIQPMFTATDVDHMKQVTGGALDLSSYTSVKIWATKIYSEVSTGAMPPAGSGEGPWGQAQVNTFGCWIQQGCPE